MAIPLMLLVALAVDTGAWYLRASELQTATDLASLAGAEALANGSTEAEVNALISEILNNNGLDPDPEDIEIDIDDSSVRVGIRDRDVNQFFSGLVRDDVSIARDSTASTGECFGCETEIELQQTRIALPEAGQGDGYRPLVIEDGPDLKIFALNHHVGSLGSHATRDNFICVNVQEQGFCDNFPIKVPGSTGIENRLVSSPGKIWYASHITNPGTNSTNYGLGCITFDGDPCSGNGHISLGTHNAIKYRWGLSNQDTGVFTSDPAVFGDRVFTVDVRGRVHCRDVNTLQQCWAPRTPSTFADTGANNWIRLSGNSYPNDTQPTINNIVSNNRLYTVWHLQNPSNFQFDVLCFDLELEEQCGDSGAWSRLRAWGRVISVFPHHVDGQENGVCYLLNTNQRRMLCIDEDANYSTMPGLALALDSLDGVDGGFPIGILNEVHRQGDILLLSRQDWANLSNSRTYCLIVDGDGGTPCNGSGVRVDTTGAYSFADVPGGVNCFVTMGHSARFDFFSPDLEDCDPGVNRFFVQACECVDGSFRFGTLTIGGEAEEVLDELFVTVEDADGNALFGPVDVLDGNNIINLQEIVEDGSSGVFLRLQANTQPGFVWDNPISASVSVAERASLVE